MKAEIVPVYVSKACLLEPFTLGCAGGDQKAGSSPDLESSYLSGVNA